MTEWNYRIVKIKGEYLICEVYFDGDKLTGYCEVEIVEETEEEMRETLKKLSTSDIIDEKEFDN